MWVQYFWCEGFFWYGCQHVFPQSVQLLYPWYGVWLEWWLEPSLDVVQVLLFALWLSQPCGGQGLLPSSQSRSPESWVWSGSIALKCVLCPKGGECWSKWGLSSHTEPKCHPCTIVLPRSNPRLYPFLHHVHPRPRIRLVLGARVLWLQESRWLCGHQGLGLLLWRTECSKRPNWRGYYEKLLSTLFLHFQKCLNP